ncbi:hypothetical protein AGMMS4957_03770 [Bacteroidia bacterium]|nr:hypothetical protein AGMMS4957_03510 [Bacteroidia bacterium]GHT19462.1 hypothetical protein AGMMS4957_03770 [Bacteroidia bacterium]
MKTLKKINLKGISEFLSERELKNVMGGYGYSYAGAFDCSTSCKGEPIGSICYFSDCSSGKCYETAQGNYRYCAK